MASFLEINSGILSFSDLERMEFVVSRITSITTFIKSSAVISYFKVKLALLSKPNIEFIITLNFCKGGSCCFIWVYTDFQLPPIHLFYLLITVNIFYVHLVLRNNP